MGALLREVLLIACGGAFGAVFRFGVSSAAYSLLGRQFPYGTLVVNLGGSLLMGAAFVVLVERFPAAAEGRALVMTGGLGAFTTFSTFALDTLMLLEQGAFVRASVNVAGSVALCVGGVWIGMFLARQL